MRRGIAAVTLRLPFGIHAQESWKVRLRDMDNSAAQRTWKRMLLAMMYLIAFTCAGGLSPQSALAQERPSVQGFVSLGAGATWPSELTLVGTAVGDISPNMTRFISTYPAGAMRLIDIGGGVLVRRHLVVGMGVSRSATRRVGRLTVELMHPEFHPTLTATAETAPLEHTQLTWHWDAGYRFDLGSRLKVAVVGGPARMQVTRRLIDDLDFEEDVNFRTGQWYILGPAYAADTLQKTGAWGYHVATDVTYRISPRIGVGALARYTRASVGYDNLIQGLIDDQPVTTQKVTSGLELSGGLRLGLTPSSARGRSTTPRWEIEGHVGAGWGNAPADEGRVPIVGAVFTTFDGRPSRTVPSWYLKEGADLFNDNAASRGNGDRLTPIDSVLDPSSVRLPQHVAFGMRIARMLGGRFAAEFTFDVSDGGFEPTEGTRDRIEQAREGFERGFTSLLAGQTNRYVSSRSGITEASGRQVLTVGALRVELLRGRRLTPFTTVGAGVISRRGALPTVSLSGTYRFTSASNTLYDQIDAVDIRFIDNAQPPRASSDDNEDCPWKGCAASRWSRSAVGVVGGGATYDLSSHVGLRVDARAYLQPDPIRVRLSTLPITFRGATRNTVSLAGTPAIQISTTGLTSSLGARLPEEEIQVARGGGIRAVFNVAGGAFWRF